MAYFGPKLDQLFTKNDQKWNFRSFFVNFALAMHKVTLQSVEHENIMRKLSPLGFLVVDDSF